MLRTNSILNMNSLFHKSYALSLDFTNDGSKLASCSDCRIFVWDIKNDKQETIIGKSLEKNMTFNELHYSIDDTKLIVSNEDKLIIYDTQNYDIINVIEPKLGFFSSIKGIYISPD